MAESVFPPEFYNSRSFTGVFLGKERSTNAAAHAFAHPCVLRYKNKGFTENLDPERRIKIQIVGTTEW